MTQVEYTAAFFKEAKRLPLVMKKKLRAQLSHLAKNPFHPKLHTKPLKGELAGQYALRITRDYRALFIFTNPRSIKLTTIGNRKDIYR